LGRSIAEELAVLLVSDLGETAGGVARARETEAAIDVLDGNLDGCSSFKEITLEPVGCVTDAEDRSGDVVPPDVDRHGGVGWGAQQRTVGQAVEHGDPVMDTDFLKLQLRRALAQVNIDAAERDHAWPGDPEQTARIAADVAGVVGMDGRGTPRKDLQ